MGEHIGQTYAEGLMANLRVVDRASIQLRRITWKIDEGWARLQAGRAAAHADWYCSLPWWRRWWVMVTHG